MKNIVKNHRVTLVILWRYLLCTEALSSYHPVIFQRIAAAKSEGYRKGVRGMISCSKAKAMWHMKIRKGSEVEEWRCDTTLIEAVKNGCLGTA